MTFGFAKMIFNNQLLRWGPAVYPRICCGTYVAGVQMQGAVLKGEMYFTKGGTSGTDDQIKKAGIVVEDHGREAY